MDPNTLGFLLLEGPRRGVFLMNEVSLYQSNEMTCAGLVGMLWELSTIFLNNRWFLLE